MDISDLRQNFARDELSRSDLDPNPFKEFELWFKEASDASVPEPNAMVLSTVDERGMPYQRSVLLKLFDEKGFVFFTNYESRKAKHIANNAQVSICFPWYRLGRQVMLEGSVSQVSQAESLKYFLSRPRGSQIGAWSSPQSEIISSRSFLEAKVAEMKRKFSEGDIPLPSFWGGYRIQPERFEFWQSRPSRLHDRFQYRPTESGEWQLERMAP